jgi:hypothetical protein
LGVERWTFSSRSTHPEAGIVILAPNGRPARQHLRSQSLGEAFDAAKRSGYRTWFFFPSLDPQDQMNELTREEAAKKLNWLFNNCPAAAAAIDGLAEEEADTGMWPRATTSSRPFNKAVTDAFENDCADPRFFDEAGVENFYTGQKAIRRNIYMLHDFFGQLLRPSEGSNQPSMNFVPSWQIGNPRKNQQSAISNQKWVDGTLANDFGRTFAYWVYTNKNRTEGVSVPSGDMLHFHDSFWKGQRRGMSPLVPAVRKLFSLDDLDRAANSGELLRQRVAYQITRGVGDDDEPTMIPGGEVVETIEVENPDGTKTKNYIQRITSKDGTDIDVADLGPGRKIEMVESTKGGAAREWSEHVLTDVARCTKYPPVYVFFLGGLTQGTEVRMVNKRIQRRKNQVRQFQLLPQYCQRWYPFWLWQNILKGRFDNVEGGIPKDWYRVRWNFPADDSVDIGREGRLYDDRLDTGKISRRIYFAMAGEDGEDMEDEIIEERVRIEMKLEDRRAALMNRAPDYTQIADRIVYDLIFKDSKTGVGPVATALRAVSGDDEEDDVSPATTASRNGSGSRHRQPSLRNA